MRSALRCRTKPSRRQHMMQREKQTRGRDCESRRCTAFSLPSMALLWKSVVLPLQTALTRYRSITGKAFMPSAYKPPFSQTTRFAFCPLSTRARHTILRCSGQPPCTLRASPPGVPNSSPIQISAVVIGQTIHTCPRSFFKILVGRSNPTFIVGTGA
jgi:hypothetical protein